jgi:rod shape determining protein RodA
MWNYKCLYRIDLRMIFLIILLMGISLLIISSMTIDFNNENMTDSFFTPFVKSQLKWFFLGWVVFLFFSGLNYRKLSEWTWILYAITIVLLIGLFFANPIQSVHRWYKLPIIGMNVQPSEYAKLMVVMGLAYVLDKNIDNLKSLSTSLYIFIIAGIPFLLILKQPDLGTALVLYPIAFVMCYFGSINKAVIRTMVICGVVGGLFVSMLFSGAISHEKMKPFFTSFLKPYQYERLNPNTYHQNAAKTAIAIGGFSGSGWKKSEFSSRKWLPASHTDSVFAAFGEEFGLIGLLILLLIFYALIYLSFQVAINAKDNLGKLLASGIAVYLIMHIIVNIAMMCGFLPISGVPLVLISYGGSSVITAMAALGMLQSIYTRRFLF